MILAQTEFICDCFDFGSISLFIDDEAEYYENASS